MVRFLITPAFEPPVHWVLISMLVVCRKGANGIALYELIACGLDCSVDIWSRHLQVSDGMGRDIKIQCHNDPDARIHFLV